MLWWAAGTRIVVTSVPKCGTHVLWKLLNVIGVPCRRELIVNDERTPAALAAHLEAARGQAVLCHLQALPVLGEIALRRHARILFISRDPRDQVVSHVFHYRTHVEHPLHPYFRDRVPALDDAIHTVIRGFGPGPDGQLPDVDTFFRYFLGWRDLPGVLATTFERLVGPRGGGSADAQLTEVGRIIRHLGVPLATPAVVSRVARKVFATDSPTFRTGRIGGWRDCFTPAHVDAFKEVAGQLLIDLGYERDLSW